MTTYNTGNPVGSAAPKDLYDNAENLDTAIHTGEKTWVDRLGNTRTSWAGATGYQILGDYAGGIEITERNQIVREGGEYWRLKGSVDLPYTTTGTWVGDDEDRFVSVGDAVLRSELALDGGVFLVKDAVASVANVTELRELTGLVDGQKLYLTSYYDGWAATMNGPTGGGSLTVDGSDTTSADDGGSVFVTADGVRVKRDDTGPQFSVWGFGLSLSGDQTSALQAAWDYAVSVDKTAVIPEGTFNFTKLTWPSANNAGGRMIGAGRYKTRLIATDPLAGYAISRADDGAIHFYGEFGNLFLGTALSGLSAAQDSNQDLWGLVAMGCGFAHIHDIVISGFGRAGLVLGQAENDNEGFGFVNTNRGGNHAYIENINVSSNGRYNVDFDQSAILAPYKFNASTIVQAQCSSIEGSAMFLKWGANNRVFGFTAEAGGTGFRFGDRATGNTVQGIYGEALDNLVASDPRADINAIRSNYVFGGGGSFSTLYQDNGDPRVLIFGEAGVNGVTEERPTATGSREDRGYWQFRGIRNNPDGWVEVKANGYGSGIDVPRLKFWDSRPTATVGQTFGGEILFENRFDGLANVTAGIRSNYLGSGFTGLVFSTNDNSDVLELRNTYLRPSVDNSMSLGGASNRYSELYAANGTINTSDANEKQQIRELGEAEKEVAASCKKLIRAFKFNDAVERKGDDARIHVGVIAQDVEQSFIDAGLDPSMYAMFCRDVWWEIDGQPASEEDEGAVQRERLGIRYEELLAFIIGAL